MQRRLVLDSIENIRDLGGVSITHGHTTRWKAFLRADHFQPWSEATQQALVEYGVSLVIDLRTPHEIKELPNRFAQSPHVQYRHIPLLTQEVHSSERFQSIDKHRQDNAEMYAFMLDECQDQIGSIFSTMAEHTGTTLFHCLAGKDRTGVVAALLLSLADAADEVIVHDYVLTAEYLAERIAKIRASVLAVGEDVERIDRLFASTPYSMQTTLQHLRARHISAPAYLRACRVSDAAIAALRARLV